jgi:hypothetical protein
LWRKRCPKLFENPVQRLLARVAEGRMAEIVAERDRLSQIFVEAECARDRARDPGRLERVRQARAVMITLGIDEDLRLVLEAPEGLRVNDAVAVALKRRSQAALFLFLARAPARVVGPYGERREPAVLVLAHASLELIRN